MDKSAEYLQFQKIQSRIWTFLNGQKLSVEKRRKPIETYGYIWEIAEQHAKSMGLDITKYIEWYLFRGLSSAGYLPVEVEKKEPQSLDFSETKVQYKVPSHLNGRKAFLKIFGTDLQRSILNQSHI
jgi:hypothetical protein